MLLQYSENKRDMQIKISFFGHPKYNNYICTIFNSKFMGKNENIIKVASIASELLRNPKTPKKVKTVAASALTQTADKKKSKK